MYENISDILLWMLEILNPDVFQEESFALVNSQHAQLKKSFYKERENTCTISITPTPFLAAEGKRATLFQTFEIN